MKRLIFDYPVEEICTKCGNVTISRSHKNANVYKSECAECVDRKIKHIQKRKVHIQYHLIKH